MGSLQIVCVYIILTHRGTYYCGMTNNLNRRWKEHRSGQNIYTKKFRAKEVVKVEFYKGYKAARKREIEIKRNGVKKEVLKYQLSILSK